LSKTVLINDRVIMLIDNIIMSRNNYIVHMWNKLFVD